MYSTYTPQYIRMYVHTYIMYLYMYTCEYSIGSARCLCSRSKYYTRACIHKVLSGDKCVHVCGGVLNFLHVLLLTNRQCVSPSLLLSVDSVSVCIHAPLGMAHNHNIGYINKKPSSPQVWWKGRWRDNHTHPSPHTLVSVYSKATQPTSPLESSRAVMTGDVRICFFFLS